MGRRGQEQPVLEARRDVPDGPRGLRIDGVTGAARRRRVMRFVQDQQRLRGEAAQPVAQPGGVGLVDQQAVGDQEARMRRPGVHGEAPLAPHARHVGAVEDGEREAEARFHLVAPLLQHRRRTRHHDPVHPSAQQQLARDQPRLDRLAEADVVGDEQVDARQAQRLPQRFELVGVDADPGAERRLEEVRIGGRDAVPRQRAQVGGEQGRLVEALSGDGPPAVVLQDPGVQLVRPAAGPGHRRRGRTGARASLRPRRPARRPPRRASGAGGRTRSGPGRGRVGRRMTESGPGRARVRQRMTECGPIRGQGRSRVHGWRDQCCRNSVQTSCILASSSALGAG